MRKLHSCGFQDFVHLVFRTDESAHQRVDVNGETDVWGASSTQKPSNYRGLETTGNRNFVESKLEIETMKLRYTPRNYDGYMDGLAPTGEPFSEDQAGGAIHFHDISREW